MVRSNPGLYTLFGSYFVETKMVYSEILSLVVSVLVMSPNRYTTVRVLVKNTGKRNIS